MSQTWLFPAHTTKLCCVRLHILVKVLQVHIFGDGLKMHGKVELLAQRHGERALAGADEAGDADESVGKGGSSA